jgi:hypothetical protein
MADNSREYTEAEAQRRFMAALKSAVTTPPKQLKDIPKKRSRTQRKRAAKKR